MNINIKELCKQIKKSHYFIWSLKGGINYLTNRHWAIKYETLPREVLVQLFTIYAEFPEEGTSLVYQGAFGVSKLDKVDIKKVFDDAQKDQIAGKVTPFIKVSGVLSMRVIKCNEKFIFVSDDYLKNISDVEESEPFCKGQLNPVTFCNNNFLVLPYRMQTVEVEILQELVTT